MIRDTYTVNLKELFISKSRGENEKGLFVYK